MGAESLSALDDALDRICKALVTWDPDIVEIIQFGSSVYAPRYAKDVDLLVITGNEKDYGGYLDAVNPDDAPFNVDVLVFNRDKAPKRELLRNILGAFKILYGDGRCLLEYAKTLGDPTFDEARTSLKAAVDYMNLAGATDDPLLKDRHIREAFDALFHAARMASMVYLSIDISRWGLVRRGLPKQYRSDFEAFINTLHLKYFYNGEYPRERLEEEFQIWLERVKDYVRKLEEESHRKL
ncbi:MAG: nucleotidyltransferase domain-containing protein [Candidatus Brockarchaeota archaeon]|nr:nucleotidyltransferase domain-containing protein [Candidatus Brockarchaeota archaeon]